MIIAQMNSLDVELVETNPNKGNFPQDYTSKINRLGKIPSFVGADGFVLNEVLAIAVYCKFSAVLLALFSLSSLPTYTQKDESYYQFQLSLS